MYRIFDKKNSGKDKELLNKYFQRWKNKTFKDNINKYKTHLDLLNIKQEDTKRIFVKSIVKGLDKRTNKDLLREYFNKWKKLTEFDRKKDFGTNTRKIMLSKIVEKKSLHFQLLLQLLLKMILQIKVQEEENIKHKIEVIFLFFFI